VGLIAFYPVYYAVDISLYQTQFLKKTAFVGLAQYTRLLTSPDFLRALGTSLVYALGSLALTLPLGMGFALLLNRPIRFKAAFRTILIIPWTLSQTVVGRATAQPPHGAAKARHQHRRQRRKQCRLSDRLPGTRIMQTKVRRPRPGRCRPASRSTCRHQTRDRTPRRSRTGVDHHLVVARRS